MQYAEQKLEVAQAAEERCRTLESQLAASHKLGDQLKTELATAQRHAQSLEIELAATQAKLEAQQAMMGELRTHLDQVRPQGTPIV